MKMGYHEPESIEVAQLFFINLIQHEFTLV